MAALDTAALNIVGKWKILEELEKTLAFRLHASSLWCEASKN
jgi:hypothetical protein